jgi:hypothetical protein
MTGRAPRSHSALAGVRRIRGVSWRWREDAPLAEISERGGEAQAGVIAQEVQQVFPDLVVEGESGYLMVDYGRLAQVLAQAVEELRARAGDLERLNATSLSDQRAKSEVDPLAGALERLNEGSGFRAERRGLLRSSAREQRPKLRRELQDDFISDFVGGNQECLRDDRSGISIGTRGLAPEVLL